MADPKESRFQNDIIAALEAQGWLVGTSDKYDKERALYPADVLGFYQEAFPDDWTKFKSMYKEDTENALLRSVAKQLDSKGALAVFRKGFKDRGAMVRLCRFKPDHGLNEETERQYALNRLRVVPEVTYSPFNPKSGRIDLVLFLNGVPVATMELKSEFKQSVQNAITQYKKDRPPKDPVTRKPEPLLAFGKRALVHFAVSQEEVYMTTKLEGPDTFFLPFNKGTESGGAGNPVNETSYDTDYLWNEVMQPDNWLRILGRFLHLQRQKKTDWDGTKYFKETLIFPRYHQWDVVNRLVACSRQEGPGRKYLVQHSAGSGKSNSIAWTAHQLASLYDADDNRVFDSVIVVTDRTVLDSQLQETIYQFEHAEGMICRINREIGDGSKSEQLAKALEDAARIIIVTIQTFPFVLDILQRRTTLKGRNYAIIADEAHSSQTGTAARMLRQVLGVEELEEGQELTAEEVMDNILEARGESGNLSYFAFTATPKGKTIELFGRRPHPELPPSKDNLPAAFHVYSMRQAIEEGFILDVLTNYTTYAMALKLAQIDPTKDEEIDSRKGSSKIAQWVRLHPVNISQKALTIIEHFRTRVAPLLNGHAKAMVVTDSRKAAVRYKLHFDKHIKQNPEWGDIQAMVAFSGEVIDTDYSADPFTENNMNPGLKGRDMRKAFDTDEYQVMIVANKFQTGFDQPKLCAMYVDKMLSGVDCVQTLSRLNRVYPGKENVFVLDFQNAPEDILAAFKPFYETAELSDVSDPNLAYEIKDKLDEERIYDWAEVEEFVQIFFDPKASQDKLLRTCRPAVDRYKARLQSVLEVIKAAQRELRLAEEHGDEVGIKNARNSLKEAQKAKDVLVIFKKDLRSFIRFYEFSSQIIDYHDHDLEKLSIYARHLHPLLREENEDDEIDLSGIEMTRYKLSKIQEQRIRLKQGEGEPLRPITSIGSKAPKPPKKDKLSEIIARMNEVFDGDFTEGDALNYARTIADKLRENATVMEQLRANTPEQAMLGDFPVAVQDAVIESMETHKDLARQFLGDPSVKRKFALLLMEVLVEQRLV